MADSFGLKIGLEGEKEFKKALADINQSFKVLGSEMKLATSQFDKNDKSVEALAARNKVLRKEIDEQTTKIDTLRKALQNAATSFGENDRRTQNRQIQLNNAEAALNDMNRELDENEKAIKEGGKAAEESGSKFEGFGKVLKTVGVALGAVAVAAGAAAVKLGKEVIAAYADYEQLVGGVDTLFKDSSQEIQRYAANAYKTAGLSANEYMETVTGFSASLIQSLCGDTEKAAKYADMAITDMSDNANKMGTDMGSIQAAYQGFAKQNYTMLDNLNRYNARNCFQELLEQGVVPIVNENDTIATYEIDSMSVFGDNDQLSAVVAALTDADLLILLSDIDGLYTDDPHVNSRAKFIETVDHLDESLMHMGKSTTGSNAGTGGMATKLSAARIAGLAGCSMIIASGDDFHSIHRVVNGEPIGTLFLPGKKDEFYLIDYLESEN